MLTFTLILEHSWNTRPFCPLGAEHLCTQGRRMFSSRMLWGSLSHQLHAKNHSMWCLWRLTILKNQKKQKVCDWKHLSLSVAVPAKPTSRRDRDSELPQPHSSTQTKTFEHEDQNATKITSALADSCIQSPWPVMSILVKTLCLSLVLMTIFLSVFHLPSSPSFVTMSSSKPIGVRRVNRWTKNPGQRLEDLYHKALALSRHNIDTVFDEEKMQPEKLTKAPWKCRYWSEYHEKQVNAINHQLRKVTISVLHLQVAWAMFLLERIGRHTKYESLSKMMKKRSRWSEVICLHQCLNELPIREFKKINHYRNSIRTRTRCTVLLLKPNSHKHSLIMADLSSRNLWGKQVHTLNFTMCQRTRAAFSSTVWVLSTGRMNSGDHRTWTSFLPKMNSTMSPICHNSENSGETNTRMCFWQRKLTAYRQTQNSCLRTMPLVGCHSSKSNDLSVHARINSAGYVRLKCESSEEEEDKIHMQRSLKWNLVRMQEGPITDSRERTADTLFDDLECVGICHWRQWLQHYWEQFRASSQMHSRHQGQATGDQIRSSKTTVLCMPSPRAGNEVTFACSTVFQNSTSASTPLQGRCHCWRCQCGSIQIHQKAAAPRFVQFFGCWNVKRDATWKQHGTPIWKQISYWLLYQKSLFST